MEESELRGTGEGYSRPSDWAPRVGHGGATGGRGVLRVRLGTRECDGDGRSVNLPVRQLVEESNRAGTESSKKNDE